MILVVHDLLSPEELASCRAAIARLSWEDGRRTAGRRGQERKQNQQLENDAFGEGRKALLDRLMTHPEVRRRVYPARALAPVINRYEAGDGYDWHTDNPVQSGLRADVSYTFFLSAPETYDGGELVVRRPEGELSFKLPAGSAVFYDSGLLHRVRPITRGTRLAAIGWAQSLVRDAHAREVLAVLKRCLLRLEGEHADAELFADLATVEAQLARRWVEPA